MTDATTQSGVATTGDGAMTEAILAKLEADPAESEDQADAKSLETPEQGEEGEATEQSSEGESDEQADEPESEASPQINDDTVIEIDGEKVTLKDLKRGNLRERDYTQKTQALAQKERNLLATAEAERTKLKQTLDSIQALTERLNPLSAFEKIDWAALAAEDAGKYAVLKEHYERTKADLKTLADARQEQASKDAQTHQGRFKEWAQAQATKLQDLYPEFKEPGKFKAKADAMDQLLSGAGFSTQEVAGNYLFMDARMWPLLNDALAYRAQEAAKKAVETKKVQTKPKVIAPQGGKDAGKSLSAKTKALKRATQTARSDREKADSIFARLNIQE